MNYYPYGMAFDQSPNRQLVNKYLYNGKELSSGLGLNVYDYITRNYDPALGRFWQTDPAANLMRRYSPYAYAFDNPIRFTDPDGMVPFDFVEREDGSIYWDNNATSQTTTKDGETYLGKNVLVATHNRDGNPNEPINSARFDLYLESNKEGPTATVYGNTVPADVDE